MNQNTLLKLRLQKRNRIFIIILLAFTCGSLTGWGITANFLWKNFLTRMKHPEKKPEFMVSHMKKELGLTSDQSEKITAVLQNHENRMKSIFEKTRPEIDQSLETLRSDMDNVLTKNQSHIWNQKFEKMKKDFLPGKPHRFRHQNQSCTDETSGE